jgi:hypothetical protein
MGLKNIVAVVNFWDGRELLPFAVNQWHKLGVDVIIVYSNLSNYGQAENNTEFLQSPNYKGCYILQCEPIPGESAMSNERYKRNVGLNKAREMHFSHIITADVDEFYESVDVDLTVNHVVRCQTYFKSPALTIGLDRTHIPFVHKITPTLKYQFNRAYPYAFAGRDLQIDPTRIFNINSGVQMSDILCHHYSYVRQDLKKKVDNSTARPNINREVLRQDLVSAKDGYFSQYYQRELHTVPNLFSLPEWPGEF